MERDMSRILSLTFFLTLAFIFSACTNNDYGRYDSNGRYYDDGRYRPTYSNRDYDRDRYYRERERERLEQERRDLAIERDRLERERERAQHHSHKEQHTSRPAPERCPSGWKPGSCSKKDRKHGCKDMRMPRGLGCRTR